MCEGKAPLRASSDSVLHTTYAEVETATSPRPRTPGKSAGTALHALLGHARLLHARLHARLHALLRHACPRDPVFFVVPLVAR